MVNIDAKYQYGLLKSFIVSRIWRWAWGHFDELVVLTKAAEVYYSKLIPSRKTTVIANGRTPSESEEISSDDYSIIESLKLKYNIIGSCALLTHRKGLDQIIKALPLLSNFALVIIGDGHIKKDLQDLAQTLKVSDRCIFLGFKHNAQSFLQYFDVYGMPSRSEGLPLALLEAAAHKKSIICSDIPVFREVFNTDEVVFFQLENIDNIAASILEALRYRVINGDAAFNKYTMEYTAEKMAEKYLQLFSSILPK
jgi:glycosyltransferase involved in cell wall biosynthesis